MTENDQVSTTKTIQCMNTKVHTKKNYQSHERALKFCEFRGKFVYKEIPEIPSYYSSKSKSENHPFFANHNKRISELLNCFGVSNKDYDRTRPSHFECINNLPVNNTPEDIEIPRLRTFDMLTCGFETLQIRIMDHEYNSKTYSVTWPHLLDDKQLEKKRNSELKWGYNFQKNKPYFYPTLIISIILRLIKLNLCGSSDTTINTTSNTTDNKKSTLLIDDETYIDRFMMDFDSYPKLEITAYLHHPSKEGDYNLQSKMNDIAVSSIYYKNKIEATSSPNIEERLSSIDQVLPSGWIVHGINCHAEKIVSSKRSSKKQTVQADLSFGSQKPKNTIKSSKIKTHQILYKDVHLPLHKLDDLTQNPERFFDYVNLPASDNTHWCFPSEYEPLQITRFNENIHHWVVRESMHIYSRKTMFVKDIEEEELLRPVKDNEWYMYLGSQSQESPIFLDDYPDLLDNNYLHPSFNVRTKETKGFYFVYRFIHIDKDHLRLYDVGVTVDVIDPENDLIKTPVGKDYLISQESMAKIVKNIEQCFQKKLNLNGFLQLPDDHQNPKYWVWTAKKVYPILDKKSKKLQKELHHLTETPFYTITGYFNGISRY